MNKKLQVYSHVRSGTHFLMSSLKNNFYQTQDLSTSVQKFGHWSEQSDYKRFFTNIEGKNSYVCEWGGLFGGHNYTPTTKSWSKQNSIYIARDGRDVVVSMYNMSSFRSAEDQDKSFENYIRSNLDWTGAPEKRVEPFQNPIKHWCESVSSWLESGVYTVKYEDMITNFDDVMIKIANNFQLSCEKAEFVSPPLVGLDPKKGKNGNWKNYFNNKDEQYFNDILELYPSIRQLIYNEDK